MSSIQEEIEELNKLIIHSGENLNIYELDSAVIEFDNKIASLNELPEDYPLYLYNISMVYYKIYKDKFWSYNEPKKSKEYTLSNKYKEDSYKSITPNTTFLVKLLIMKQFLALDHDINVLYKYCLEYINLIKEINTKDLIEYEEDILDTIDHMFFSFKPNNLDKIYKELVNNLNEVNDNKRMNNLINYIKWYYYVHKEKPNNEDHLYFINLSREILENLPENHKISYMIYELISESYQTMDDFDNAEQILISEFNMYPLRRQPHNALIRFYYNTGQVEKENKFKKIASMI